MGDTNTSINLLTSTGANMNNDYISMRNNNYSVFKTNSGDSMQRIVNSINQNLAALDIIQNQLSVLSNVNQENLIKREQLIKMQNEELMEQLRNLEQIQSNIENKNRMIEQVNYNMSNQQNNISLLIISIIIGIILLGTVFLYSYGNISYNLFIIIIITILIIYICIFIYKYNIFYLNTAITNLFSGNMEARIAQSLNNWGNVTNLQNDIYGSKDTWIKNNCTCAPNTNTSEEEEGGNNNQQHIKINMLSNYPFWCPCTWIQFGVWFV